MVKGERSGSPGAFEVPLTRGLSRQALVAVVDSFLEDHRQGTSSGLGVERSRMDCKLLVRPSAEGVMYRRAAHYNITHRRRQAFYDLPTAHQAVLKAPPINMLSKFDRVDDAIDANAAIASDICKYIKETFLDDSKHPAYHPAEFSQERSASQDIHQVSAAIRQLYRDWSAEGSVERELCYQPVVDEIMERCGNINTYLKPKVLVPGSGLGRLAWEIYNRGFRVEANELSFHQLITSDFIFFAQDRYKLYPFATSFANQLSVEHQLMSVTVPDIGGEEMHARRPERFSYPELGYGYDSDDEWDPNASYESHEYDFVKLVLGNFTHVYKHDKYAAAFDVVATVFFIDTATNLLRYIETIRHCLRDGGIWINLGPLLWHSKDQRSASQEQGDDGGEMESGQDGAVPQQDRGSIELTEEEIMALVKMSGFEVEKHEIRGQPVGYVQNPESMLQSFYRVSFWVARKLGP